MPRSTGKAARRKARQRKQQPTATRPSTVTPASVAAIEPAEPPRPSDAVPPRPPAPRRREREVTGSSRLTGAAAAEYGYVLRELRSIGLLSAGLLVALLLCWLAFNALGLIAT